MPGAGEPPRLPVGVAERISELGRLAGGADIDTLAPTLSGPGI
ncbi:hypothetical protein [Streptomyces sp. WAC 01420]